MTQTTQGRLLVLTRDVHMISVIIPWRNRNDIGITLLANRALFEYHRADVVIVNAGGEVDQVVRLIQTSGTRGVRIVTIPCSTFNRSLCLNIGTLLSRMDHLFFLDSDIVLTTDVISESLDQIATGNRFTAIAEITESAQSNPLSQQSPKWFLLRRIVNTSEFITHDGRRAMTRHIVTANSHAGDGLVILAKHHATAVGGLNARLTGWGFEDTDLQLRLQLHLGLERVGLGSAIHLTHDRPDGGATKSANSTLAMENYINGRFLGSLEEDRAEWLERLDTTLA